MKLSNILFLASLCLLLSACGPKVIVEESKVIDSTGWAYDNELTFSFDITDTTSVYDIWVEMEHDVDFPYQNFYSNIRTEFPDGKEQVQLLSFEIAEKSGRWFGKCNDESCHIEIPLQVGARFDQIGDYLIGFEQYSRKDSLWGIKDFTFKLTESEM